METIGRVSHLHFKLKDLKYFVWVLNRHFVPSKCCNQQRPDDKYEILAKYLCCI